MNSSSQIEVLHFKPIPLLSKYVRKISVFKSKSHLSYVQKLTPSAFMYLTYHHQDIPPNILGGKKYSPDFRLQIDGPKTKNEVFIQYDGILNRIFVEFSASGFYYLFHVSPSDYTEKLLNLNNFLPDEEVQELENQLQASDDSEKQISIIQTFLQELIYKALPSCEYIERALAIINKKNGSISIADLSDEIGISKRQLNRQFTKIVGLSPKHYARILQLHYIISKMSMKNYGSMQEIALNSEFYDLAHFSRGFKELTGFSPVEFIQSNHHIALKYFTNLIK